MRLAIITYILFFLLTGCSNRQELYPIWAIEVSEGSKVEIKNNKPFLISPNGIFEINVKTAKLTESIEREFKNKYNGIGSTRKDNSLKKWKLTNTKDSFYLFESFSSIDNCQLSLNKYWLEKVDRYNRNTSYSLGKKERYHVADFTVFQNMLFIIKNPVKGGDAYHLEKYKIE